MKAYTFILNESGKVELNHLNWVLFKVRQHIAILNIFFFIYRKSYQRDITITCADLCLSRMVSLLPYALTQTQRKMPKHGRLSFRSLHWLPVLGECREPARHTKEGFWWNGNKQGIYYRPPGCWGHVVELSEDTSSTFSPGLDGQHHHDDPGILCHEH